MWVIVAAFLAVQVSIVWFAANGPFVDEALYTVAGMRVLEGHGPADGYVAWFNGSPFVWPVMAALGHHLAGLPGARLVAVLLSAVTLVAFARTAETLFGPRAAAWGTAALGVNGLFAALAHFAVYDVPALTGLAVAMWCATRSSKSDDLRWPIAAGVAFAFAVISKYGYLLMALPLLGLLVSARDRNHVGRRVAVFLSVAGVLVATYFLLCFGTLVPASMTAYLEQTFRRTRGHIAVLQVIFGLGPLALASAGAIAVWRNGCHMLVATCLAALLLYPAFHLWTANFVSGQKHVVAGFLFAYLLAGVALERLWKGWSRAALAVLLSVLAAWGGLQWYWQEHSWSDTRALTSHLAASLRHGERVLADSAWIYTLSLYPRGLIDAPSDVIDVNHSPDVDHVDVCQIPWLVGHPETTERIRRAMARCGHRPVISSVTRHYYFDTTRFRLDAFTAVVSLYRLPGP